jgi:hypothetical protein
VTSANDIAAIAVEPSDLSPPKFSPVELLVQMSLEDMVTKNNLGQTKTEWHGWRSLKLKFFRGHPPCQTKTSSLVCSWEAKLKLCCQNKLPAEVFWSRGRSLAQNFVFAEKIFPLKFMFSTCVLGAEHFCHQSTSHAARNSNNNDNNTDWTLLPPKHIITKAKGGNKSTCRLLSTGMPPFICLCC